MTVLLDATFLAAGLASEGCRSAILGALFEQILLASIKLKHPFTNAMKALAILSFILPLITAQLRAEESAPPDLRATLHLELSDKGVIRLRFDTLAGSTQSFDSSEYRYALLDNNGVQIEDAQKLNVLVHIGTAIHTTQLPPAKQSVPDYSDYLLINRDLKADEQYYLVVSVRNLTALATFKAQ